MTKRVEEILSWYEGQTPGVKTNLARLLNHGRLGGTGRMIILPVDQGFEHGPDRSFSMNPAALDPHYLFRLAIDAGLSAYAAPLGLLEAGSDTFAGQIPLILKMNSSNLMTRFAHSSSLADQALTASLEDALRLGCVGIGFTIYPGSDNTYGLFEEIREIANRAKSYGLVVVIWSYPRGNMSKAGEMALDVISYSAHMAALLGAHIIKVKLPNNHFEYSDSQEVYARYGRDFSTLEARVRHIMECTFQGRRLVVFSGGAGKSHEEVMNDARAIKAGGGHGSIIGRNAFQRQRDDALQMLDKLIQVYKD